MKESSGSATAHTDRIILLSIEVRGSLLLINFLYDDIGLKDLFSRFRDYAAGWQLIIRSERLLTAYGLKTKVSG